MPFIRWLAALRSAKWAADSARQLKEPPAGTPYKSRSDTVQRGRKADSPGDIPPKGWRDIALRVKEELSRDNVSLIAAGLALYALLSAFPALTAGISIYGVFASPEQVAQQFSGIADVLPDQAADILRSAMQSIAERQGQALGFGAVVGILVALWSARKGMSALMEATNVAYDEREERGFVRRTLVSLGFTLGAVVGFLAVLLLAVAAPLAIENLGLPPPLQVAAALGRWVVLWLLIVIALAVVYRYAPDRDEPKWRWVTWGSAIAASLWVIGSVLFSLYVRNFGSYGETYGALGGVVVLLLWFYLSGYIVVLGAEINSEMERQTAEDTTHGAREPRGQRDAYAADTVGRSP